MYRPGSTLIEQMSATHPDIFAAGEFNYLPEVFGRQKAPLSESI